MAGYRFWNPLRIATQRHLQSALNALGYLVRAPLGTLMTLGVIAIAFALPCGLYLMLDNLQQLGTSWDRGPSLSVYLRHNTSEARGREFATELASDPRIAATRYLSRQRALEEFRALSGLGDILEALGDNPLPAVIQVDVRENLYDPTTLEQLHSAITAHSEVEMAQLDLQWLQRLQALIALAQRSIELLGGLLFLAVFMIVGNTIRLEILKRQHEIEVFKLVGASDAFVRRPFLYTGFWLGLGGGLLAWLLIALSTGLLEQPVQRLAGLYQSPFQLRGISGSMTLLLLMVASLSGIAGAWVSVTQQLRRIQPS